MTFDETRFVLALARLPGVGRRRLKQLLAAPPASAPASVADFLAFVEHHARAIKLRLHTSRQVVDAWSHGGVLAEACRRRGWALIAHRRPGYPSVLLRLHDPPALLFVQGGRLDDPRVRVAVIGTREPTSWGEESACTMAQASIEAGAIVVAGLAWGVDTIAHRTAVERHRPTWAALPGPLDIIFPGSNRGLAERIVETGGALISEYLPGTRPHATFFVERDRLQAAIADFVVVIETGMAGGTMHTVRFARELKVPVYVTLPAGALDRLDGELEEVTRGTVSLVRSGARTIGPAMWRR